jgi:soluble lytic murein transglycosylase-like protein
MRRTKRSVVLTILVASGWLSLCTSARAQIASYIDGSGKVIFINGDSTRHASRSTISPPTALTQVPPAAAGALSTAGVARATANQVLGETERFAERQRANSNLDNIVRAAAARHQMDPALVKAVITTESSWNPMAISNKGAAGLMQLIPGMAQRYGVRNRLDPAQNIEGWTTYLKWLLDRYNGDLTKSLAAYNAGEHAVDMFGGVPSYPETRKYVQKVTDIYFQHDSGRNSSFWSSPRPAVRREVDSDGRLVFTNQ